MPFSFKPPEGAPQPSAFSAEGITARIKETKGGIFSFISYLVLGITITIAVLLYLYSLQLSSQVADLKTKLDSYDASLAGMQLTDMQKLSDRIRFIGQVVNGHASVNSAFRILEESVENQVLFTRFDLRANPNSGNYDLTLSALAPDYRSVAQQLDTIKTKTFLKYFSSVELVSINPDDKGRVLFTIKAPLSIKGYLPETLTFDNSTTPAAAGQQSNSSVGSSTSKNQTP